jgi:hypothetical protein
MASRTKPTTRTPARKALAEKQAAKKQAAKKQAAKKQAAKKQPAKKQPAKRQAAKKQPAKKQPAKRQAAKKQPAKKQPAKKQPAKRQAAKKQSASKKAATGRATGRAPASGQPAHETAHAITSELMAHVRTDGLRAERAIAEAVDDVAPCRLVDHGEGRFSLCFDDFRMPRLPAFDERGLAGNGYTWEAVVDALLRRRRPDLVEQTGYDSESAMFVATGARPTLLIVAALIREALADAALLKTAIESAHPDRLE